MFTHHHILAENETVHMKTETSVKWANKLKDSLWNWPSVRLLLFSLLSRHGEMKSICKHRSINQSVKQSTNLPISPQTEHWWWISRYKELTHCCLEIVFSVNEEQIPALLFYSCQSASYQQNLTLYQIFSNLLLESLRLSRREETTELNTQ